MSDDLVKRLNKSSSSPYSCQGCMDIEREEAADRIEKLEAALDDVAEHLARADWYYLKPETRKVLEGKNE